jgi:citronellyl-CoA dehydrogenase
VFRKMGALGLLGIAKPVECGGLGLDYSYQIVFSEELGRIKSGGVGMGIGVQTDMATPALAKFGSDELRREFLAPAISRRICRLDRGERAGGRLGRRGDHHARREGR